MNINKVYYLILIFGFAFQTSFTQNNYDVVKSDKEWRSQLDELSYLVLRKAYTEDHILENMMIFMKKARIIVLDVMSLFISLIINIIPFVDGLVLIER